MEAGATGRRSQAGTDFPERAGRSPESRAPSVVSHVAFARDHNQQEPRPLLVSCDSSDSGDSEAPGCLSVRL